MMRRARAAGFFVALVVALVLPVTGVTRAAVITVTTTADGVTADGACSLREAVISANTDQALGGCAAGAGADVIAIDPGLPRPATFQLTATGADEDAGRTGDLDLTGNLTINGDGAAAIIVDGRNLDRVFEVRSGAAVVLTGLTVKSGAVVGSGGGGILVDATGNLALTNSVVSGNTATTGGGLLVLGSLSAAGVSISGNSGGGIAIDGGGASLKNVQVTGNTGGAGVLNRNQASLDYDGGEIRKNNNGGISNESGRATLTRLQIADNAGSGVSNVGAVYTPLAISLSTVTGNHAAQGGGLSNAGVGAIASVMSSSFTGNSALGSGGGLYNNGLLSVSASLVAGNLARSGAGIDHAGGNLHLLNDTISGNIAADNGGGLYNRGAATVEHVTFFNNSAAGSNTGAEIFNDTASMTLRNTMIEGGTDNCTNSEGFVTSLGHNLETGDSCALKAPGDLVRTSGELEALAANGGPTLTHALRASSPAIDAADGTECPALDQRGVTRPRGRGCDIGAFEWDGARNTTPRTLLPLITH